MHPILFHYGPITIHTYGVAMATAFIVAIYLAARKSKILGMDPNIVLDMSFWIIIGSIIGARIVFITTIWSYYMQHPLEMLEIWRGGLVFYGGFFGGLLAMYIYLKWIRESFFKLADLIAPYMGLGYAIHRAFGCYMNGCGFGKPTTLPWPIGSIFVLSSDAGLAYPGQRLLSTELFMSLNGLVLFVFLLWYGKRFKKNNGEVAGLFLILYSFDRFIIEFFRGDIIRGLIGTLHSHFAYITSNTAGFAPILSVSQLISIPTFIAGWIIFIWARTKKENEKSAKLQKAR